MPLRSALLAIVTTSLAAAAAHAGTMTIDLDKNQYVVGETITVTATGTLDTTDVVQNLGVVCIQMQWDSAVATVTNAPAGVGFGTSSQVVTQGPNAGLAALAGPTTDFIADADTDCSDAGTCLLINQIYVGSAGWSPADQIVVGTLVLTANAVGALSPVVSIVSIISDFGVITDVNHVVLGPNWGDAEVVPEPTTAALLGLGLLGLGITRRRPSPGTCGRGSSTPHRSHPRSNARSRSQCC